MVIARTSSFQFRDKALSVQEIGQVLGAAFIVEGSVRRLGERLRITAQLVEAATGRHLWAERYDRDLADLYARLAARPDSSGVYHANDEGDERVDRKSTRLNSSH